MREISRGPSGVVWLAHDHELERNVAIKLLPELDERQMPRLEPFLRETVALQRLAHPHIVQIHDVGVHASVPYIVMELLQGETLAEYLAREGAVGVAEFHPLFLQAASALQAAHSAGLLHFDFQPSSVVLVPQGHGHAVKLVGFSSPLAGRQRRQRLDLTDEDCPVQATRYMSPELVMEADVDHRTDLWSLAVVAYEALTGRVPFHAHVLTATLVKICRELPPRPSSVVPSLGRDLDSFFDRALAKDPIHRYSAAQEMAAAFSELSTLPAAATGS